MRDVNEITREKFTYSFSIVLAKSNKDRMIVSWFFWKLDFRPAKMRDQLQGDTNTNGFGDILKTGRQIFNG